MKRPTIKQVLSIAALAAAAFAAWSNRRELAVPVPSDDPLDRPSFDMPKRSAKKPAPKPAPKPEPKAEPTPPPEPIIAKKRPALSAFGTLKVPVTLPQWCILVDAEIDGMAMLTNDVTLSNAIALERRGFGVVDPTSNSFTVSELGLLYMNTVPLSRRQDAAPVVPPPIPAREAQGWQPIATAPTHLRVLLFGYHEGGGREVAMCFRENIGANDWVYSPQGGELAWTPALWMPVPVIPEE